MDNVCEGVGKRHGENILEFSGKGDLWKMQPEGLPKVRNDLTTETLNPVG